MATVTWPPGLGAVRAVSADARVAGGPREWASLWPLAWCRSQADLCTCRGSAFRRRRGHQRRRERFLIWASRSLPHLGVESASLRQRQMAWQRAPDCAAGRATPHGDGSTAAYSHRGVCRSEWRRTVPNRDGASFQIWGGSRGRSEKIATRDWPTHRQGKRRDQLTSPAACHLAGAPGPDRGSTRTSGTTRHTGTPRSRPMWAGRGYVRFFPETRHRDGEGNSLTMSNVRPHRIEMERLFCIKVSSSTMVNWRTGQEIRLTCYEGTSRRDRECMECKQCMWSGVKGGYRLVFIKRICRMTNSPCLWRM